MKISHVINGTELTVKLEGRLDSATSGEFSDFIEEHFVGDINDLMLDFADVDFISSKGLRVLVTIFKNLGNRKMEIINANSSVVDVLRVSGLLKIFTLQ